MPIEHAERSVDAGGGGSGEHGSGASGITTEYDDAALMEELTGGAEDSSGEEEAAAGSEGGEEEGGGEAEPKPEGEEGEGKVDAKAAEGEAEGAEGEEEPAAEPWRAHLQPDETPEAALQRIAQERDHYHGWATRVTSEEKETRENLKALREQWARAEPILQALREQKARQDAEEQRKRQEAEAANAPDPDTEPDRAILHELKTLRERQEQSEIQREADAAAARLAAKEAEISGYWGEVDRRAFGTLSQGFEADPEFKAAHDHVAGAVYNTLKLDLLQDEPGLSDEEAGERAHRALVVLETQTLRNLAIKGIDMAESFKARARAMGWTGGNGKGAGEAPATPASPAPAAPASKGSSEVDRIRRAAAKKDAAKGATALGGSPSRKGETAVSVDSIDEEELLMAVLDGRIGEKDLLPELREMV